jgi:hypothetical protein
MGDVQILGKLIKCIVYIGGEDLFKETSKEGAQRPTIEVDAEKADDRSRRRKGMQVEPLSSFFLNPAHIKVSLVYATGNIPIQCVMIRTCDVGYMIPLSRQRTREFTDILHEVMDHLRLTDCAIYAYPLPVCALIPGLSPVLFMSCILRSSQNVLSYEQFYREFCTWFMYTPELVIHPDFVCKRIPSMSLQQYIAIMSTDMATAGRALIQRGSKYYTYISHGDPMKFEVLRLLEPYHIITFKLDGDHTMCLHATDDDELQALVRERNMGVQDKLDLYNQHRDIPIKDLYVQTLKFFMKLWRNRLSPKLLVDILSFL